MTFYNLKNYFPISLTRCRILVPVLKSEKHYSCIAITKKLQLRRSMKENAFENEVHICLQSYKTPSFSNPQNRQFISDRFPPVPQNEDDSRTSLYDDIPDPSFDPLNSNLEKTLQIEMENMSLSQKKELLQSIRDQKLGSKNVVPLCDLVIQYANELDETNLNKSLHNLNQATFTKNFVASDLHKLKEFKILLHKLMQKYLIMSTNDLLLALHCLIKFEVEPSSKYFEGLLQILKFHVSEMSIKNILFLDSKLKIFDTKKANELCFALSIMMEKHLTPDYLNTVHLQELLRLLGYCVQNKVKGTDEVINEINSRNVYSPTYALSLLWNIFDIPRYPIRNCIINPENEITVEILTKECLTVIASNIKEFSQDTLRTTLSKAESAFNSGSTYVYHEYFFQELAEMAIREDWNIFFRTVMILEQFKMNYINESFINAYVDKACKIGFSGNNAKHLHNISAISCLRNAPKRIATFLDGILAECFTGDVEKAQTPWILKAAEFCSLGHFSKELLEAIFFNENLERIIKPKPLMMQVTDVENLLLINFILKHNPKFSYLSLSENLKRFCVSVIRENLRVTSTRWNPTFNKAVANVLGDPMNYASNVQYQHDLFIEKLLVINENGLPVPINGSESNLTSYSEFQNIKEHKKIIIMNIPKRWIFNSDKILYGIARLKIDTYISEGFQVVQSLAIGDQNEREKQLEMQLRQLGVQL